MKKKVVINSALIVLLVAASNSAVAQTAQTAIRQTAAARSIIVATAPKAVIWLNELRRGTTDDAGRLEIKNVAPGTQTLRIRANGFAEKTQVLNARQTGEIAVELSKTVDEAELAFQQAETLRESGRETNRPAAVEAYRRALKIKPNYLAARIGLARVLSDLSEIEAALKEITAARKLRPGSAETSAVEGRIFRAGNDTDNAVKAFQRAIREARGVQPEAYTGLALTYQDAGENEKAVAAFRTAAAQLADTEPVIYQLLAESLEKLRRTDEAVAAYEKFLALAPDNNQASAVRSIIEQLKKQKSGDTLELMPQ